MTVTSPHSPGRHGHGHGHEDDIDDVTVGLQVQQFLDEWHFRVLHSGLAYSWDRPQALVKAMDIFEASGMQITQEEKEYLSELDENQMIEGLVHRMPMAMKRTIEHFLLQLQLVLSTATRVRNALEEGSPDEVAKIMEDGDTGITQQILKEVVIEAGREVGELQEVHHSWDSSMAMRVARLLRCAEDAEIAAVDLEKVSADTDIFRGKQSQKTTKVLMSMINAQDKALVTAAFSGWSSWLANYKSEKSIHLKFKTEVETVESKLMECKTMQLSNLRSVLNRRAEGDKNALMHEVMNGWKKYVQLEKAERKNGNDLKFAEEKLCGLKTAQKENARQTMMRMVAGSDEGACIMVFQAWANWHEEYKKNKHFEDSVQAAEQQMKEYMQRKAADARGVLQRMVGESDTGLLSTTFTAWMEDWKIEKQNRETQEALDQTESKFKSLNVRQKAAASGTAKRSTQMQDDIMMMQIFMNWQTEVKMEHVRRHYMGKMDSKEQKFEAVQTMIKSFASQLEQGIGNSPRGHKSKSRGHASASDSSSRPPAPPA